MINKDNNRQHGGTQSAFLQYVQVNKFERKEVYDTTVGFFTCAASFIRRSI